MHKEEYEQTRKGPVIILIVVLILIAAALISFAMKVGKGDKKEVPQKKKEEQVMTAEEQGLKKKDRIETILLLGIDELHKDRSEKGFQGTGHSDMMTLLVLDHAAKEYIIYTIDRDTMVEVEILDGDNELIGTMDAQICTQHAYGKDREYRVGLTMKRVSELLGGIEIDHYMTMDLDFTMPLNHALGGVTVTVEDDLTKEDASLVKGKTLTLTDEQAQIFVHGRQGVADGTNVNRMGRQKTYLMAAKELMMEKMSQDDGIVRQIYDEVEDYMMSDMNYKKFAKVAGQIYQYEEKEAPVVEGDHLLNEECNWIEFYPDEKSLQEAINQLFYQTGQQESDAAGQTD